MSRGELLGVIVRRYLSSGELFRSNCPRGKSLGSNCLGGSFIAAIVRGEVVQGGLFRGNRPGGAKVWGVTFLRGNCTGGSCSGGISKG